MPTSRYRNATVATLFLLGALLFAVANPGGGGVTLTLDRELDSIAAGEPVGGLATEDSSEQITVRMYVDGELVEEDVQMEGSGNEFGFVVPGWAAGRNVTIEAENSTGDITRRNFTPLPPKE